MDVVEEPSVLLPEPFQFVGLFCGFLDEHPSAGPIQYLAEFVEPVGHHDLIVVGHLHLVVEKVVPRLLQSERFQELFYLLVVVGRQLLPWVPA